MLKRVQYQSRNEKDQTEISNLSEARSSKIDCSNDPIAKKDEASDTLSSTRKNGDINVMISRCTLSINYEDHTLIEFCSITIESQKQCFIKKCFIR